MVHIGELNDWSLEGKDVWFRSRAQQMLESRLEVDPGSWA